MAVNWLERYIEVARENGLILVDTFQHILLGTGSHMDARAISMVVSVPASRLLSWIGFSLNRDKTQYRADSNIVLPDDDIINSVWNSVYRERFTKLLHRLSNRDESPSIADTIADNLLKTVDELSPLLGSDKLIDSTSHLRYRYVDGRKFSIYIDSSTSGVILTIHIHRSNEQPLNMIKISADVGDSYIDIYNRIDRRLDRTVYMEESIKWCIDSFLETHRNVMKRYIDKWLSNEL